MMLRPLLRGAFAGVLVLAAEGLTPATQETGARLTDLQISADGATEALVFTASGEVQCSMQRQEDPPRLILQFPATRNEVRGRALPAGLKLLSTVQLEEAGDGAFGTSTRVVLGLKQPAQVDIGRSPGRVTVVLRPATAPAPARADEDEIISLYLAQPAGTGAIISQETAPAGADPLLGPQDLLQIRVLGVEALERRARIAADGTITLPLVGSVPASGRTAAGLELEIAQRLEGSFVKDPQVTVFVEEYRSRRVSVSGAVRRAGSFEILRPTSLLEVLALAGGVLAEEATSRIQLVRSGAGQPPGMLEIDLAALQGGDLTRNLQLAPGDLVHVPFEEMLEVHVQGRVMKPDRYRLRRSSAPTVLRAVLLAGGPAGSHAGRRVEVVRRGEVTASRTLVLNLQRIRDGKDPDLPVEGGDIIVVR